MTGCTPISPPSQHVDVLARRAESLNPANVVDVDIGGVDQPQKIAVLRSKYFGQDQRVLTVSFLERTDRGLRNLILDYANRWQCGIRFEFTQGTGDVRISRGRGGYWSYLGTDVLSIPTSRQTMNLAGFTMQTRESEFDRVVTHEFGHTLGFPHEHMRAEIIARIDREKAYAYFRRTSGWSRSTVNSQVLTPLNESALIATHPDDTSIMSYHLPGSIMRDGKSVPGGAKINRLDREFAQRVYPRGTVEPVDPEPVDPEPIEPLPDTDWDDVPFTDNDWT